MVKACLVFIVKDNLGGAERRLTRSFDAIENAQIDIIVWDRSKDTKLFDEVRNYRLKNNSNMIRCTNPIKLASTILLGRYRWVCYFDCSGTIPIIPVTAKISGAKRLWILASTIFTNVDQATSKHKKLFYRFAKYASRVDCLYPSRVRRMKELIGDVKCTATPIPFTNFEIFFPKEKSNIIAFLSRMVPIKHPIEAVAAINKISEDVRKRKYKLIIGGAGPLFEEVKKYIADNKLEDIVEAPGYINSADLLPKTKIFLSLQDFTNYPSQSLIEAISCGCWCIASNLGETNILVKKEFGELVNLEIDSIANAILRAMDMDDKFINEELVFAKRSFDIANSAKYYSNIITGEY